jgi:hypothetical protein
LKREEDHKLFGKGLGYTKGKESAGLQTVLLAFWMMDDEMGYPGVGRRDSRRRIYTFAFSRDGGYER